MEEKRKFNIASDILGGQILARERILSQWRFILFLFGLIIFYITITLQVEKTQLTQIRNQREIKNLKSDYTSKAARLQYASKRGEVESRLSNQGSKLIKPIKPAKRVRKD